MSIPASASAVCTRCKNLAIGLQGKCDKWSRHKWVGSRGPLAHAELRQQWWAEWLLLGDSVSIQWVPSHVQAEGNEQADLHVRQGAKARSDSTQQHSLPQANSDQLCLNCLPPTPPPPCASTALSKHMSPCYRRFGGRFLTTVFMVRNGTLRVGFASWGAASCFW